MLFQSCHCLSQACPDCGWGELLEYTPTVIEAHRLQAGPEPLSLAECADHVVLDTIRRPLSDAPRALRLVIGTISIRAEAWLDVALGEEAEALALLGIPPDGGEGLALWALLN